MVGPRPRPHSRSSSLLRDRGVAILRSVIHKKTPNRSPCDHERVKVTQDLTLVHLELSVFPSKCVAHRRLASQKMSPIAFESHSASVTGQSLRLRNSPVYLLSHLSSTGRDGETNFLVPVHTNGGTVDGQGPSRRRTIPTKAIKGSHARILMSVDIVLLGHWRILDIMSRPQ